jgi:hypothetical protein
LSGGYLPGKLSLSSFVSDATGVVDLRGGIGGFTTVQQVIGDGLRSRIDERRMTEVNVAVYVLNRMLELGRPNYVRIV